MLKLGIFICLLFGLSDSAPHGSTCRIIKGNSAEPACLGALVSEKHVVTTARCVYRVQPSELSAAASEGEPQRIVKVVVHPFYNPPNDNYDVAILETGLTLTSTGITGIEETKTPPNANLIAVQDDNTAKIVVPNECQKELGNSLRLSSKMICARVKSDVPEGSALINVDTAKLVGVAFNGGKGLLKVFTKFSNSEISSFIKNNIK